MILSAQDFKWRNKNHFRANKNTQVSKIFELQKQRVISSTSIHQMLKVKNKTSGSEERFSQDRN